MIKNFLKPRGLKDNEDGKDLKLPLIRILGSALWSLESNDYCYKYAWQDFLCTNYIYIYDWWHKLFTLVNILKY